MQNAVKKRATTKRFEPSPSFEMFKVAHSSREVGLSPNTIRKLSREAGLRLYKVGKIVFASRSEVVAFMKAQPSPQVGCSPNPKAKKEASGS